MVPERYFDKDLNPITAAQWLRLFGNLKYRFVAMDEIESEDTRVFTIWEGMDAKDREPPLIFESMVFGGPLNFVSQRYATLQQALDGHAELVHQVRFVTTGQE